MKVTSRQRGVGREIVVKFVGGGSGEVEGGLLRARVVWCKARVIVRVRMIVRVIMRIIVNHFYTINKSLRNISVRWVTPAMRTVPVVLLLQGYCSVDYCIVYKQGVSSLNTFIEVNKVSNSFISYKCAIKSSYYAKLYRNICNKIILKV